MTGRLTSWFGSFTWRALATSTTNILIFTQKADNNPKTTVRFADIVSAKVLLGRVINRKTENKHLKVGSSVWEMGYSICPQKNWASAHILLNNQFQGQILKVEMRKVQLMKIKLTWNFSKRANYAHFGEGLSILTLASCWSFKHLFLFVSMSTTGGGSDSTNQRQRSGQWL